MQFQTHKPPFDQSRSPVHDAGGAVGNRISMLSVIAIAALCSGCVAIKQPPLRGPEPASRLPQNLVVGVQKPEGTA